MTDKQLANWKRREYVGEQISKLLVRLDPHKGKRKMQWWLHTTEGIREAVRVVLVEQLQACTSEEFYPKEE